MKFEAFIFGNLLFVILFSDMVMRKRGSFEGDQSTHSIRNLSWKVAFLFSFTPVIWVLWGFTQSDPLLRSPSSLIGTGGAAFHSELGSILLWSMLSIWSFFALFSTVLMRSVLKRFFFKKFTKRGLWLSESLLYLVVVWGSAFTFMIHSMLKDKHSTFLGITIWALVVIVNLFLLRPREIDLKMPEENSDLMGNHSKENLNDQLSSSST